MKLRKKQTVAIAIGAVIALLLGTIVANRIDHTNDTLRNQQQTIEQTTTDKMKLQDTLKDTETRLQQKQQETQQKDEKIQDLEKQVQARAESKRIAALAAAEAQKQAARIQPAASFNPGTGDCAAEAAKYPWPQQVAYNVMMAESGGATWKVNDNPATGDYSIGCFQINIYGANAASRPSEAALKDAATNVAFAYRIWSENGRSFIGQWGVCRGKVACS